MASTDNTLSGRQSLAGLSVLGTAAIPGAQAATKAATPQSSSGAWDKAMADLERAKAAHEAYDAPYSCIEEAFKAEANKVLHVTVEMRGRPAADARNAKIKAIDKRLGRSAAVKHSDALSEVISNAEEILLNLPAPDGEALLWKVNRLYAPGEGLWEPDYEAQTHTDLRRFLSIGSA